MLKTKSRIDHAKNAQLAYMINSGDLVYKDSESEDLEPTDYDPFGEP